MQSWRIVERLESVFVCITPRCGPLEHGPVRKTWRPIEEMDHKTDLRGGSDINQRCLDACLELRIFSLIYGLVLGEQVWVSICRKEANPTNPAEDVGQH